MVQPQRWHKRLLKVLIKWPILKLAYAQFEELERFSRYGTRLEEGVRKQLERGRRVREVLKQPQYEPIPVADQIAAMFAAIEGLFDDLPAEKVNDAEAPIRQAVTGQHGDLVGRIAEGGEISDSDRAALRKTIEQAIRPMMPPGEPDATGAREAPTSPQEQEEAE